jgi:hypothetical protein
MRLSPSTTRAPLRVSKTCVLIPSEWNEAAKQPEDSCKLESKSFCHSTPNVAEAVGTCSVVVSDPATSHATEFNALTVQESSFVKKKYQNMIQSNFRETKCKWDSYNINGNSNSRYLLNLVKKFSLYDTRRFITVFTRARHWSLTCAR